MPDERAIMTYVSSYYHCFAGKIKVISRFLLQYHWPFPIDNRKKRKHLWPLIIKRVIFEWLLKAFHFFSFKQELVFAVLWQNTGWIDLDYREALLIEVKQTKEPLHEFDTRAFANGLACWVPPEKACSHEEWIERYVQPRLGRTSPAVRHESL